MGKHLFYLQISLLLILAYLARFDNILSNGLLTLPFAVGTIISLWSFYNMGSKIYSPFPEPKKNGQIVQRGIYKYVRHPMYSGLVLIAATFMLSTANFPTFIIFVALVYVIDEKATLEEKLLTKIHKEYTAYQSKTKKFIPYVY